MREGDVEKIEHTKIDTDGTLVNLVRHFVWLMYVFFVFFLCVE